MARIARIGLIAAALVALIMIGLIGFVTVQDSVSAGSLTRSAEPRVFWGGGSSDITLTYSPPANLVCPPARRAANVILLIDKSESMLDNDAFPAALAAAEAFINTIDFSISRAGIIAFDDEPHLIAAPTQDREQLRAALADITPQGATEIGGALDYANSQLDSLTGQTANLPGILMILTDGGAHDEEAALVVGRRLKDAGTRLITIGTGQADAGFLRELASSPNDYLEVRDPAQLTDVYTRLAEQLNTAIAFDISLVESVAEPLIVASDSLAPVGSLVDNTITWYAASLPTGGATFTYRADVGGLGLRNINSGDTVMSYTDCIAGAVSTTLLAGPQVLVLPPAWIMALLVLIPLLPLLFMALFRRPKSQPASMPTSAPLPPLPEPADLTPAWLTRLDDRKAILGETAEVEQEDLTPTLIIGVGPVGRIVLPQIAQALRGRYGNRWPAAVNLLQVDVVPKGANGQFLECPDHLRPEQWVLLEPDLDEVSRNLQRSPERYPYLTWYRESAPGYARSRGRMAVFYDLKDGAPQSRLWQALSKATASLEKPKIRLVGSTFDDTGSGMLVDLARLAQLLLQTDVDVEMWLSLPVGQPWSTRLNNPRQMIAPNEQAVRTLATLRELERFQRNAVVPFNYVSADHAQGQLHEDARMAVVQSLFLFETSAEDPETHLVTLTDALLATLPKDSQQAISQHLAGNKVRANMLINEQGIGMVSSLGAYAVRLPSHATSDALTWRMLYDLLYDTRIGLLPIAQLKENGEYEKVDLSEFQETMEEAVNLRESAEDFVKGFHGRTSSESFRSHVAHRVADILNGESGGVTALARAGGMLRAANWIAATRAVLLREGQLEAAQNLTALEEQLTAWRDSLTNDIQSHVEEKLNRSRDTLKDLGAQSGRNWVMPEGYDWGAYREQIRPWTTGNPSTNTAGEPLLRAAQRFGWYVAYNEVGRRWQLELLAPPGDFRWTDGNVDYEAMSVDRNSTIFADSLYRLIHPLAGDGRSPLMVFDGADNLDLTNWVQQAASRLSYNETEASDEVGGGGRGELFLLVAPRSDRAKALQKRLQDVTPARQSVNLIETKDNSAVVLMRVRDRIPLYTLNKYGSEAWERQGVLPGLYVWRGEQLAAEIETDGVPLGPVFVGWLERDPDLLELFARAYLLGLYQFSNDGSYLPGLETWPGQSVGQALDNLMSGDRSLRPAALARDRDRQRALSTLGEQLETKQHALWQSPGKQIYLLDADERLVEPLFQSKDRRERDLARYLKVLLNRLDQENR